MKVFLFLLTAEKIFLQESSVFIPLIRNMLSVGAPASCLVDNCTKLVPQKWSKVSLYKTDNK